MSIQEKFYEVCVNSADLGPSSNSSIPRRLSIQGNIDSESISSLSTSNDSISVGSLLLFNSYLHYDPLKWALKDLRFSRLLSVESSSVLYSTCYWKSFPASICKLPYLETIHVEGWIDKCIPNEIWIMKQLRHLDASLGIKLKPPVIVGHTLSNLKVLSFVQVDKETSILFQKSLFPNLRKLHLGKRHRIFIEHIIDESMASEILASLESLQNLQILKLSSFKFGQLLDLFPLSLKLTKITFVRCKFFSKHLMESLGKLANLRILKIRRCDTSWQLHFVADKFPQLEVFKMIGLIDIETWELETHAMPNLQHLAIEECKNLRNLPDELWSLVNLRTVELSEIRQDLKEKLMIKQSKMKEDGYSCKLIVN
ncbi:hypothetical protein FEM48_Zijuj07G0053400 [Ziziphus jujuba var. spinosa]|uniref:Disease resistance R13L4/SHOC-2-like LRR domain-containing protein n=1 Tax=Ziziphus jujuba var. spinosa TaxID=714518 RepID=A0A978V2P7_ZIZJJ|nr:hypothetical protein FEM48_Zijuj07G0053400 [Ziziphus jujuba var. spinosa]